MKFLIDANVSHRLVAHVRHLGHDVLSALETNPNASDSVLLTCALEEYRTVVTYDKDFGELVFKDQQKHCGVVLLRVRGESFHVQRGVLERFLTTYRPREIQEAFWTVTDTTVRRVIT